MGVLPRTSSPLSHQLSPGRPCSWSFAFSGCHGGQLQKRDAQFFSQGARPGRARAAARAVALRPCSRSSRASEASSRPNHGHRGGSHRDRRRRRSASCFPRRLGSNAGAPGQVWASAQCPKWELAGQPTPSTRGHTDSPGNAAVAGPPLTVTLRPGPQNSDASALASFHFVH